MSRRARGRLKGKSALFWPDMRATYRKTRTPTSNRLGHEVSLPLRFASSLPYIEDGNTVNTFSSSLDHYVFLFLPYTPLMGAPLWGPRSKISSSPSLPAEDGAPRWGRPAHDAKKRRGGFPKGGEKHSRRDTNPEFSGGHFIRNRFPRKLDLQVTSKALLLLLLPLLPLTRGATVKTRPTSSVSEMELEDDWFD